MWNGRADGIRKLGRFGALTKNKLPCLVFVTRVSDNFRLENPVDTKKAKE